MTNEPDPIDRLADAASRVATARGADKDAFWLAGLAGGAAFFWLSSTEQLGEAWALLAIVGAFGIVYRVAKIVLYRQRGLGKLPLFGNLLPSSVPLAGNAEAKESSPAPPASDEPRTASVPRLPFTRTPPAAEVILSEQLALETLRAGRAGTRYDDLPLGVLMLTSAGIAFLPEERSQLENMFGDLPGALVGELAGKLLPPVEQFQSLKDYAEATTPPPHLADWTARSLRQKHAFVIAWGDLVGIFAARGGVLLERRNDEGDASFTLLMDATALVSTLMQRRILTDLRETVMQFVLRPKVQELLPQVEAELSAASPGQDADSLQAQARKEAAERAMRWFSETSPPMEALVKEKMQPALEGYAKLPRIVANQPWLFAADETTTVH